MRPMSRQMANEKELAAVTAYVSGLKAMRVAPTLGGDVEKGKTSYAVCGACHGPTGQGNPQLKAPPLAGQADLYLVSQMKKFKTGIRGQEIGPDEVVIGHCELQAHHCREHAGRCEEHQRGDDEAAAYDGLRPEGR